MKEPKKPEMHVALEEPNEKRRDVLNSAIETIELLKRYEKFKKIKKEKDIRRRELGIIMKEMKTLFSEITEMLPVVETPTEAPRREPIKAAPMKKPEPVKEKIEFRRPIEKKDPHMEKLEKDLQALKDKIARI